MISPRMIGRAAVPISTGSRGRPFICARIRNLGSRVLPRRTSGRERLSGNPPCGRTAASRHGVARTTSPLGKGEASDLAALGKGQRHRDKARLCDWMGFGTNPRTLGCATLWSHDGSAVGGTDNADRDDHFGTLVIRRFDVSRALGMTISMGLVAVGILAVAEMRVCFGCGGCPFRNISGAL
jgi:hypothetical protein